MNKKTKVCTSIIVITILAIFMVFKTSHPHTVADLITDSNSVSYICVTIEPDNTVDPISTFLTYDENEIKDFVQLLGEINIKRENRYSYIEYSGNLYDIEFGLNHNPSISIATNGLVYDKKYEYEVVNPLNLPKILNYIKYNFEERR